VPLELGRALHQAIQGSRLVVVPGAGHNVMFECPVQFNRLVLDFLAE
jgi:pimeloyl-ACP methyl ester carboxylesterase